MDTQSNLWGVFVSKYSKEQKIAAIQQYLQSDDSFKVIADRLEIDLSSFKKWVRHYQQHGMAAFEKKHSDYDAAFKLNVLKYVCSHNVSHQQAAAIFDIRNHGIIAKWQSLYQTGGFDALNSKRKGRPRVARKKTVKKPDHERSQEELLEELEYLRAENAYLKKLDALIQEEEEMAARKQPPSKG